MGLCKCPRKKVTQQFCFEHKVNVCEYCMINAHQKCVVRPYIQWLDDSSYKSTCNLCSQELANEGCVRLRCYHIFHWRCLDNFGDNLPPNTAPGGYTCPDCHKVIFPSSETNSPVSDELKRVLATARWSRAGLGLPFIDSPNDRLYNAPHETSVQIVHHEVPVDTGGAHPIPVNHTNTSFVSSNVNEINGFAGGSRSKLLNSESSYEHLSNSFIDIDEDKYRKKSPMEIVNRWMRSFNIDNRRRIPTYRRWIILCMIAVIAFFTLLHFLIKYGRASADNDPLLDPHFNPNIHIENHYQKT